MLQEKHTEGPRVMKKPVYSLVKLSEWSMSINHIIWMIQSHVKSVVRTDHC